MAGASDIELHGSWALPDLVKFQYFHLLRRTWLLLPVMAVGVLLAPALLVFGDNGPIEANTLPFSGICLLFMLIMVLAPQWAARRQWKVQTSLREPRTIWFDAEGMRTQGVDSSSSVAWRVFLSVRETRSLFLLYHAPNMAYLLPKRFF